MGMIKTGAAAGAVLMALVASCPLLGMRLWHQDKPRTSQRRAAQEALKPDLMVTLIMGGNRSGKTQLGGMIAVAWALGSGHPYTQSWARMNHLDISAIPEKGGRVCAVALTNLDSVKVQRKAVDSYLPGGCKWFRKEALTEAKVVLPGGGAIIFKSVDQKARAFQGDAYDLLWLDEEPTESVFNEARMRLADRAGRAIFTMTPLKGKTWVHTRFIADPEARSNVVWLSSRDNPHVPQDYLEALLAQYGPHERAARERGEFTSLEGRVYDFYRDLHVVDDFPVPADWPRFQAWDYGTRNPTAVLWAALDPTDDTLYVYRERYQAGKTIREHGKAVVQEETCGHCDGYHQIPIDPALDGDRLLAYWLAHWGSQGALTRENEAQAKDIGEAMAPEYRLEATTPGWDPPEGWQVMTSETHPGQTDLHPDWIDQEPRALSCVYCHHHPGRSEPEPRRVGDPAAKQERTYLRRHFSMKIKPAKNAIRLGLSMVASRLSPDASGRVHMVVFKSCKNTISEFEGYVWDSNNSKSDQPDKPLKKDDHAMDAVRYLVADVDGGGVGIAAT